LTFRAASAYCFARRRNSKSRVPDVARATASSSLPKQGDLPMTQPMPGKDEVSRFQEAYDKLRAEVQGVQPSDYSIINVDIPNAITTVLGALPGIRALRPRIVAELSQFDIARFDKLETYALALGHAHAGYMAASQPSESLEALSEEATDLRDLLLSDATALAHRSLIEADRLKQLKGTKGYRNLSFDLLALVRLFRDSWPSLTNKTAVQMPELRRAESLADRILTAVGSREQAPVTVTEAAETRQRAYTCSSAPTSMRSARCVFSEPRRKIGMTSPPRSTRDRARGERRKARRRRILRY
jgi:hypothetical protein